MIPNPHIISVDIHKNGLTSKGRLHRDYSSESIVWNVVVPLSGDAKSRGGTFILHSQTFPKRHDRMEGTSLTCAPNQYFMFDANDR